MSQYATNLNGVREAAARIKEYVHRTPVMTCATMDRLARCALFFKCENFQKAGAFKFRGACNAVFRLSDAEAKRGVVTHSSGNHAQALALAAKLRGIPAHVVMPSNALAVKKNAVRGYGGHIIECEPNLIAREETAARVLEETGGVLIPPYDHPHIIAGQGTVALELLEQVDNLDAIVVPVGGGGLMAGVAIAAKEMKPGIRVYAAEPQGADDAARSKMSGKLISQTSPNTIADGLLTSLGELTWPVLRDLVDDVLVVDDAEIVRAMRLMWERAKLLIEPSAAVAVASVLAEGVGEVRRVGVVLSGGNADLDRLRMIRW